MAVPALRPTGIARLVAVAVSLATTPASADPSPLAGRSYIVQMSGSQVGSGYARYLLPPLRRAFERAGLVYRGGPGAEWVATVDTSADVGAWTGSGEARRWLHTREVSVDLRPAAEAEQAYEGAPRGVAARLLTPNEDREDEYACLVDLAVAALVAAPAPKGRRVIDGSACARR